jgi:1-acyl-sn-glycerol-3-phosphate acyltransferase
MVYLRSALFMLCLAIITPLFAAGVLLAAPFGGAASYAVARGWCWSAMRLVRAVCGLDWRVEGAEHIPQGRPIVVLSKHQSAWETIFFLLLFPRQVPVVKRELLFLPFFGWALALLHPIAINRSAGRAALGQIIEQGKRRLADGLWVVVFPEGTRTAPGHAGRYAAGGAWLASQAGAAVLPVAHNSGLFWRRNAFLKYPGTITVSIGQPIEPAGRSAQELNRRAAEWIEAEATRLCRTDGGGDGDRR